MKPQHKPRQFPAIPNLKEFLTDKKGLVAKKENTLAIPFNQNHKY